MPNINLSGTAILAIVAVGIAAFFLLFKKRALDITSQANIISGPVNQAIAAASGVQGDTVGTSINRGVENLRNVIGDAVRRISPGENLPSYFDHTQAWKTCMAFKRQRGFVVSQRCQDIIANEAPGTTSIYSGPPR